MSKFAAHIGNMHASVRVTAFFDSAIQAREAASSLGHKDAWVCEISNWKEHQEWNKQRVGMYATNPVQE
jgi:hypothetical protein